MILRCTKKLLRLVGADPAADPGPAPDAEDWYANLLWFDRRKCLLLTHAATLFSMFEAGVRAADLRDTHQLVTGLIGRELAREGLPATTSGALGDQELIVTRTADCSVLGCMNDMAVLCEHAIATSGGLQQAQHADLNRALRRNINSARGYQRPIDLARQRLPGQHRQLKHAGPPKALALGGLPQPTVSEQRSRTAAYGSFCTSGRTYGG